MSMFLLSKITRLGCRLTAFEAVKLAKAEAPGPPMDTIATGVDAGAEMLAADALIVEKWHFAELWRGVGIGKYSK